jgi:hypothetical protein
MGPRSRGCPAPEQGGTSPEGATSPRARWSFTSAVPCTSSEAEFRPTVARLTVWWAAGPWVYHTRVLGSLVFVFYEGKRVFPGCLGDPYGCPR